MAKENVAAIEIIKLKDFEASISSMWSMGAERKRRAEKIFSIIGRLNIGIKAFDGVPLTNHGESRIKGALKYDIGGGYRLITIHSEKVIALCFAGDHDECDKWLNANSGLTIARSDGVWAPIFKSTSANEPIRRTPIPSAEKLLERLDVSRWDELLSDVPASVIMKLDDLGTLTLPEEVYAFCAVIADDSRRSLVQDVLILLLNSDITGAERRLDLEKGLAIEVDDLSAEEIMQIRDGDQIRRVRVGSDDYKKWFERFAKNAPYFEWLLFMHPEQEAVVEEDFSGPAQLSGVSGSGKTCVAVRRALRLASGNPEAKILVVTLNRSLAGLIKLLTEEAGADTDTAKRISVSSFFELCQTLLATFEPKNSRLYSDVTWKTDEHIDEVFREFYRRWHNYQKAKVLLPVHLSLTAQGVDAEVYLREEFDWIRSALHNSERNDYLMVERAGRKFPIPERWRERILKGLAAWEEKMKLIGVIDYLGLAAAVLNHFNSLTPQYDHIIIDEAQDFGTTELSILRRLVRDGENNLFLCGDIAQHVLPKHRSLQKAGISIAGRTRRITRNYRNSREILKAAYKVLIENLDEDLIDSSDLEILDPQYANRSSPVPAVLKANSLSEEFSYARSMISDHLENRPNDRCCIAFAGYSLREVQGFASSLGLPILDGLNKPNKSSLVLSDLEQTKGYEFNVMVVLNCREGILPPKDLPAEEAFRYGCRLYVTMTRARDELYMSYSGRPSPWLELAKAELAFMDWSDVVGIQEGFVVPELRHLPEVEDGPQEDDVKNLTGKQFIYSPFARGLSGDALLRIDELVDGVGLISDRKRVRWQTMGQLKEDLENQPSARAAFGPRVQMEIRGVLEKL